MIERPRPVEGSGIVKTFFVSEQRKPLHRSTVDYLLKNRQPRHPALLCPSPHMLRHACGVALPIRERIRGSFRTTWATRKMEDTVKYTAHQPGLVEKTVAVAHAGIYM